MCGSASDSLTTRASEIVILGHNVVTHGSLVIVQRLSPSPLSRKSRSVDASLSLETAQCALHVESCVNVRQSRFELRS